MKDAPADVAQPREKTRDEIRDEFLAEVRSAVSYWTNLHLNVDPASKHNVTERLKGLAGSILVMIDGESAHLPGFILAPNPTSGDKAYHTGEGKDYFPENYESGVKADISGSLHDLL